MWLFTRYGFFSVTRSRQEPEKLQIRARAKEDLEKLVDFAGGFGWYPGEHFSEIIETPAADYRYRMLCVPSQWAAMAEMLAFDIDYPNFKDEITDPKRHRLYAQVWGVMLALQRPVMDSRQRSLFDDDLEDVAEDPGLLDDGGRLAFLDELEEDASAPVFDEDLDTDPTSPFYDPARK